MLIPGPPPQPVHQGPGGAGPGAHRTQETPLVAWGPLEATGSKGQRCRGASGSSRALGVTEGNCARGEGAGETSRAGGFAVAWLLARP